MFTQTAFRGPNKAKSTMMIKYLVFQRNAYVEMLLFCELMSVNQGKYKPQENFKTIYISALKTLENP